MAKYDYNLIVIGAGAAGLVSSYIAAAVKAKVLLIERHKMGGDCLNTGCVPSKALLRSAKMVSYQRRAAEFGLKPSEPEVDFAQVMERVQGVIKQVEPHDSIERYQSLGVEVKTGEAKLVDRHHVEVNEVTYSTKAIIIASGARAYVPPIKGLDLVPYHTSDTIWRLRKLPKELLVLGGGPIGCELAQAFMRLGAKVKLINAAPRLLIKEDPEIGQLMEAKFIAEGAEIYHQYKGVEFQVNQGQATLIAEGPKGQVKVPFDEVLIAVGRAANSQVPGLAELGIKLRENKTIEADGFLRTNIKNIYVAGDITGPYQFTHTAAHQAWYASVNALFSPFKKFAVNYTVIPWCTYTDPEVAQVGLNETAAKEKGIPFEVTTYPLDDLDRAIAERETAGFVKVITPKGSDRILGVTIVGAHAGDLIAEYVLAMKYGLGLNKILGTIHIYPTFAEANKMAAGRWKAAHAPQGLLSWVAKFHRWRRG